MQRNLLPVDTGVVVGDVQASELTDGPLDQGFDFGGLAHVCLLENGPAAGLPASKVGAFTPALYDEAKKNGWTVISMKNDWKRIFAFE